MLIKKGNRDKDLYKKVIDWFKINEVVSYRYQLKLYYRVYPRDNKELVNYLSAIYYRVGKKEIDYYSLFKFTEHYLVLKNFPPNLIVELINIEVYKYTVGVEAKKLISFSSDVSKKEIH